jgi:hypothetical protein
MSTYLNSDHVQTIQHDSNSHERKASLKPASRETRRKVENSVLIREGVIVVVTMNQVRVKPSNNSISKLALKKVEPSKSKVKESNKSMPVLQKVQLKKSKDKEQSSKAKARDKAEKSDSLVIPVLKKTKHAKSKDSSKREDKSDSISKLALKKVEPIKSKVKESNKSISTKPVLQKVQLKTPKDEEPSSSSPSAKSLSDVLDRVKNGLERLELPSAGVEKSVVSKLSKSLGALKHIDLSDNALSEKTQMKLITAVLEAKTVSTLVLDGNDKIDKENCQKIGELLKANHILTKFVASFSCKSAEFEIYMERNRIVQGYMDTLRKANALPDARAISPRDNDLVARLLLIIRNDPSTTELIIDGDVRFEHLRKSMVLDLAESLRTNFHLKTIKVNNVELGNTFLSTLASSIETNFTLETLDLANNSFTSEALADFCVAMAKNKSLVNVDLRKQHSPMSSHAERDAIKTLTGNKVVQKFRIELRSDKCEELLESLIERNKKRNKVMTSADYDKKLVAYLKEEAEQAGKLEAQRKDGKSDVKTVLTEDWGYLYELSERADQYNTTDKVDEEEDEHDHDTSSNKKKGAILERTLGMDNFTADGSFLTAAFIEKYLVENRDVGSLTFQFNNQFKMFKRFPIGDKARSLIVKKFADAIVDHPRSSEITHIFLANINCNDDLIERICERCVADPKLLPRLHMLNLETNNIFGPGIVALAGCIASPNAWKYLQNIKLENQSRLMRTEGEAALAKALDANQSVIRLGMRVRNLLERDRIGRYLQRNMDYQRKARLEYAIKTGSVTERSRNKMEKYIDSIAADDPGISEVEIVGDQLFLGLNGTEVLNAAKCFGTNTHVKRVKLCNLGLDDKFAAALAKSIKTNSAIEYLCVDSNAISGEGIKAITESLSHNTSITELQMRHQKKNMAAADEDKIAGLLGGNETIVKMGVDLRSHSARSNLDRKMQQNAATRRKNRSSARKAESTPPTSTGSQSMIKSVETQNLLTKVVEGDHNVTEVKLDNDQEFIQLEKFRKEEFYKSLHTNKTVSTLALNDVQLDNEFADELAVILKSSSTLNVVSLNKNAFTSPGVFAIAMAAKKNKKLRKLSILKPRFKITNEHAEELLAAMEKKSYLHELDIEFREKEFTKRLDKILAKNKSKK